MPIGYPELRPATTPEKPKEALAQLCASHRDALVMLCQGLTRAEIAQRQRCSVKAIDHRLQRTYLKLGVMTAVQAAVLVGRAGLA